MRKWAFNPMTSVLRRDREMEERHGGEGDGKTETEIGLMEPQAKEHPGLPAVARIRRHKEGILPQELPLGETHPATAFISAPRTVTEYSSAISSHSVVGICTASSRKRIQPLKQRHNRFLKSSQTY